MSGCFHYILRCEAKETVSLFLEPMIPVEHLKFMHQDQVLRLDCDLEYFKSSFHVVDGYLVNVNEALRPHALPIHK